VSVAARILDRLERVKQTGPRRWVARCPAHDDRSPSLSICELDDGRVLLHDFGGCGIDGVLAALGLGVSDLFEKSLAGSQEFQATHSRVPARDLLVILDHELTVAVFILDEIVRRRTVNESQVQRLIKAANRVGRARDEANAARITHAA
jgi:hypothetical protein